MKRLGLRSEIVLQLSLLMAAAMLFSSVLFLKFYEQAMLQQQVESAINHLQLLARNIPADPDKALPSDLKLSLTNSPINFLVFQRGQLAPVVLIEGSSQSEINQRTLQQVNISGTDNFQVKTIKTHFGWQKMESLLVTIPVQERTTRHGALQAQFSLQLLSEKISNFYILVTLTAAIFGMVLTLFGSYLLSKNVVAPVIELKTASKQVAAGNLEVHLNEMRSQTFADLANSFNSMTKALRKSRSDKDQHIAELEKLNQQLQQTQNELIQSEKMASIGHLAAGMAHEIGNPLGALIGYLSLLNKQPEGATAEITTAALSEAERIDQLVRDLLDYARPAVSPATVIDIRDAIEASLNILTQQGMIDTKRVQFEITEGRHLVAIASNRLQQVIINLLKNALDASPPDSTITLKCYSERDKVVVAIANKGDQIKAEQISSLFDPFYTTKDPDKGRGLGLFVCHNILSDAQGRIDVSSSQNGLTCFTIELPHAGEHHGSA